jgi:uncharacterized protein DUF5666
VSRRGRSTDSDQQRRSEYVLQPFRSGPDRNVVLATGLVPEQAAASVTPPVVCPSVVHCVEPPSDRRGVVTAISAQTITIQTTAKKTTTLTLSDKTTFKQAGKMAHLADIKVGDRVVIDVQSTRHGRRDASLR